MINKQTPEEEILTYLPLVEKVAKGMTIKSHQYEYDDLYQFGVIGLLDAMEKYDASKNVAFESYAYTRIRGAIIDEVRRTSPVTRSGMDLLKNYYQTKELLERELEREPKEAEIAAYMDVTVKQLDGIYTTIHHLSAISLEKVIFSKENSHTTIGDYIADNRIEDFDQALILEEEKETLRQAIQTLAGREQEILQLIYVEKLAMKEIAYIYDISIPRVSQIHGKVINKLRDELRRKIID
ncbi:RNA polymerase sigma factor FliA [Jeotgalibaca dankookensis]|uniref:RNA polymerase sigma factor FliA n=1 Tax=Jeotgalibaca dankookensis TaxID=708126 RepID=A0A1S6IRM9_9LACT|nr:FliA/WhiG family RNA polymerase sigma factor [Jeotgalibaca dankookensis]AQS54213.1 RNA polymerase sigma factor FliA [Jeotgalibaca dankookensis]